MKKFYILNHWLKCIYVDALCMQILYSYIVIPSYNNILFNIQNNSTYYFSAISAGETATASMTVSIQDENDNWPIIEGTFTTEIDEELPEGSLVPSSFSVSDADVDDVLRYTMSGKVFSILPS